jgi:phosphatidate cytidylyltransferase
MPRVLTAGLGLPVLVGAVWLGSTWLTFLVVAAALVGWWEFHRMFWANGSSRFIVFGVLWTVLLVVSAKLTFRWGVVDLPLLSYATVGVGMFLTLPWPVGLWAGRDFASRARLAVGPIYVGFLLAHSLVLRDMDGGSDVGRNWLLFVLLSTFSFDTGAFFVGRTWGSHSLAPSVSPGKTWEGAIGGVLMALGAALGMGAILELPMAEVVCLGLVIGIVGQIGDLGESKLKRVAGIKDAGSLLPGHGGILDRLDSILITVPVVYYLKMGFVLL